MNGALRNLKQTNVIGKAQNVRCTCNSTPSSHSRNTDTDARYYITDEAHSDDMNRTDLPMRNL